MDLSHHVGHQGQRMPMQHYVLAVATVAVLSGAQAATQYCAWSFAFAPELGWRYGRFFPLWDWLLWVHQWRDTAPEVFRASAVVAAVTFAVVLAAGVYLHLHTRRKVTDTLHGSARWATRWEVFGSGLLRRDRGDSVVVGAIRGWWGGLRLLRHGGLQHVLCFAPTGAGKGVSLVVPTLLSWRKSVLVTDLKGELFQLTAGFRRLIGQRVYRFAPGEEDSMAWNPLHEIRKGTAHEMGDAQQVAQMLVDPDGKGLTNHWLRTAWALLTGLILYVLHIDDGPTTLHRVDELLADPSRPLKELWEEMVASGNKVLSEFAQGTDSKEVLRVVGRYGSDMKNRPEEEAGSVLSTAQTSLALYRDPIVAKNTSRCDLFIAELMHHPKAHALYLVAQPTDKERLRPLTRLFIAMTVRTLCKDIKIEDGAPKANYRHALLLMLDEFPALGKLALLEGSLAYMRGYGIKCYLICQDTVQLEAAYGKTEAITSNCHVQVCFAPNRVETAERISRMLGKTTVQYKTATGKDRPASEQWTQRALLTADEVLTLPGPRKNGRDQITRPGDLIVIVAGKRPIYGVQPLYFRDPALARRARLPATIPARQVA